MAKVILVFGSTTDNTEMLSEHVAAGLERGGAGVTVKNVTEASVDELVTEGFKVDGEVEPAFDDAEAWGLKVAKSMQK